LSLFTELKRRNVFRVAAAYIIVGWLLLQVSDTLVPALHLPEVFNSAVAFILIIGFPIAVILAWAYEITPEGLKKEIEVDRSQSITDRTGRKLDFAIITVLAIAIVYLAGPANSGSGKTRSSRAPLPPPAGQSLSCRLKTVVQMKKTQSSLPPGCTMSY